MRTRRVGRFVAPVFFAAAAVCAAPMLAGYAAEGIFIPLYLAVCGLWVLKPGALKSFFGGRRVLNIVISSLLCAAGAVILVIVCLMAGACCKSAGARQTVIVLGCQVNGDEPSPMLRRRCEAAAGYLLQHGDAVAIASGGRGDGDNLSEAAVIKNTLVALGVPPGRIVEESRSTDTRENMLYSAELIESLGLSREAATVTDAFHQYRAGAFARAAGIDAAPVNCETGFFSALCFWCREIVAVLHMWIFGS